MTRYKFLFNFRNIQGQIMEHIKKIRGCTAGFKKQQTINHKIPQIVQKIKKSFSLPTHNLTSTNKTQTFYKKSSSSATFHYKDIVFCINSKNKDIRLDSANNQLKGQKVLIREKNPNLNNHAKQNNNRLILRRNMQQQQKDTNNTRVVNFIMKVRQIAEKLQDIYKIRADMKFQIQLNKMQLMFLQTKSQSVMSLQQSALHQLNSSFAILNRCMQRRQSIAIQKTRLDNNSFGQSVNQIQVDNKKLSLDLQLMKSKYKMEHQRTLQLYQQLNKLKKSKINLKPDTRSCKHTTIRVKHIIVGNTQDKSIQVNMQHQIIDNTSQQIISQHNELIPKINILSSPHQRNPSLHLPQQQNQPHLLKIQTLEKAYQHIKRLQFILLNLKQKGINICNIIKEGQELNIRPARNNYIQNGGDLCSYYKYQEGNRNLLEVNMRKCMFGCNCDGLYIQKDKHRDKDSMNCSQYIITQAPLKLMTKQQFQCISEDQINNGIYSLQVDRYMNFLGKKMQD